MLIIGTLTVKEQLALMRDRDPGFQGNRCSVEMNREANAKFSAIKEEIKHSFHRVGVTTASQRLGNNIHQTTFAFERPKEGTKKTYTSGINVDKDFFKVYGIAMAAGRDFRADVPTDDVGDQ